jgi:integrase
MRLTTTTIRTLTLPDGKSDYIFFDDDLPGFGIRMRAGGGKTWVAQYSIAGRSRKMVLGSVAVLDPGRARQAAKDILAKARLGGDPANEKVVARVHAAETFGALLTSFLPFQKSKVRPTSYWANDYHLSRLCKPLHALPITSLTRRIVAAHIAKILEAKGPATTNRLHTSLSAFCTWAVKEGFLETNPVSYTNKPPENRTRSRLLTDDELIAIWHGSADMARSSIGLAGRGSRRDARSEVCEFNVILQLLVLTGLRKSEISDLAWSEIDLEANLITLPPTRTKNKRVHLVPMSKPVRALIEAQPHESGRDLLFGARSVRGFTAWSRLKDKLDSQITQTRGGPLAHWTLHDFRRKFSTDLHEKLNVPPHVVETLIGHVGHRSGVAGVYNKSSYLEESARALGRWADLVMALVSDKSAKATVVPLRAR